MLDELTSVIDETLNLVLTDLLSDNMLDQYLPLTRLDGASRTGQCG